MTHLLAVTFATLRLAREIGGAILALVLTGCLVVIAAAIAEALS